MAFGYPEDGPCTVQSMNSSSDHGKNRACAEESAPLVMAFDPHQHKRPNQASIPLHLPDMGNSMTQSCAPNEDIPEKCCEIHSPPSSTHKINPPETSTAPSSSIIIKPRPSPLTHLGNHAGSEMTDPPDMNNWFTPLSSPKEDIPAKSHDIHGPSSSRTPMSSPKEDIHKRWNDIQSLSDTLPIDRQNQWLLQEILRYGDLAQATSIAFKLGSYCGNCQHHLGMLLDQIRLNKHGYKVTKFIYAHLGSSGCMGNGAGAQRDDSNLIGYVAVSNEVELHRSNEVELHPIGRRDIAVAWRGTKTWSEGFKVIKTQLVHIDDDDDVMVADGFNSIYTSKTDASMYNKSSASEQVMGEVKRLVKLYKDDKGEEVRLTITGHSLGGALALLNAYEVASSLPQLSICVVSFGAPQVGNGPFRDKLKQMEVKTIRVVIKQDMVPMWPGRLINENLYNWAFKLVGQANCLFKHVGKKLTLDADGFNMPEAHNLETYLSHLNSSDGSASELPCGCSSCCGIGEQSPIEK